MPQSTVSGIRETSARTAFCSILTALGVCLMLTGGLIPIFTYCSPLAAGALLIPVLAEYGKSSAWRVYTATALISLLLGADKEAAFFYLFLGYYPVVKALFDRISSKPARLLAKLGFFAASVAVMYVFLYFLLRLDTLREELASSEALVNAAFFVLLAVTMMVYDTLLARLSVLYVRRLRPRLKFLKKNR